MKLIGLIDVNAILKQALERSPAYGSIKDVLGSFNDDQVRLISIEFEIIQIFTYITCFVFSSIK